MGSAVLSDAISSIRDWSVTDLKEKRDARVTGTFGSLVFNDEVQQARLPKAVYHALRRTMTHGEPLDAAAADSVATAVKEWAVEHGATHYTHWFQPLTGITAEKACAPPSRRAATRRGIRPARHGCSTAAAPSRW
jgi:glutamine synthetase